MDVILAHNLSIGYHLPKGRVKTVHSSLDVALKEGTLTCLMGLNGAGKSTLLKTLCGLLPPLRGEVLVYGRKLDAYGAHELSRVIGVVLTGSGNVSGMTVRELVSIGRYPHTGFFGRLRESDEVVVRDAAASVGLLSKLECNISELSDGERQKAFIAKVLAQECPVMVLDEPTAFLDVTSRIEVLALLRRLAAEQGKSILLSTHDLDSALQMAGELWLQEPGREMLCGSPQQMVSGGALERFFCREATRFDSSSCRIVPAVK